MPCSFQAPPRAALVALAVLAAPALHASPAPSPSQLFQLARESQTIGDYPTMLAYLRQAAQEGDADAQATLGLMQLAGPAIYGSAVAADRCGAIGWLQRAADQGNRFAHQQLAALLPLHHAPAGSPACLATGG